MKAMLIAIFRAMRRRKLAQPKPEPKSVAFRTNNVVQFDRRQQPRPTPRQYVISRTADEENYEQARKACESAWPQVVIAAPEPTPTDNHVNNFHSSGGSFDGGGSSGDWNSSDSSSSSSDSGSFSCDSGSSSFGSD